MPETYEEIVRRHYMRLRDRFIDALMLKYQNSRMRREDAENIYQDTFLAIQENLMLGRIRENTSWNSYIMTIGMNLASKQYRKIGKIDSADEHEEDDEDRQSALTRRVEDILKSLPEEETPLYQMPEAQAVLGDEIEHTPEPCASIIRFTYFSGLTDQEITEELDRYNSAKAVKAKRWQCMKDLIYRVKVGLYMAGIIADKPVKQ